MRRLDLTGQKFGRLTVLGYVETRGHNSYWYCECDCGGTVTARGQHLKQGDIHSCGCLQVENGKKHGGKSNPIHGMSETRIFRIWQGMWFRCTNKGTLAYKDYGGRGITVCDAWREFKQFYSDMGPSYQPGLTIDRIDNDGNYEPGNCRWIPLKDQARNTRNNHILSVDGFTGCLVEAAERFGVNPSTLSSRLLLGWSDEDALLRSVRKVTRHAV